jgi:hypothetical protein
MSDQSLSTAHRLLRQHAPDWIGPLRDAIDGLAEFRAWNENRGTTTEEERQGGRNDLAARLSSAYTEIEKMSAALEFPQASDRTWRS